MMFILARTLKQGHADQNGDSRHLSKCRDTGKAAEIDSQLEPYKGIHL